MYTIAEPSWKGNNSIPPSHTHTHTTLSLSLSFTLSLFFSLFTSLSVLPASLSILDRAGPVTPNKLLLRFVAGVTPHL